MKKLFAISMTINVLLIGLLVAQTAQAKVKTYDAVKLAEYSACLNSIAFGDRGSIEFQIDDATIYCRKYKP